MSKLFKKFLKAFEIEAPDITKPEPAAPPVTPEERRRLEKCAACILIGRGCKKNTFMLVKKLTIEELYEIINDGY